MARAVSPICARSVDALGFDGGDACARALDGGGGASALGFERGAVGVDGCGGGFLCGLEGFGALERGELFVFEFEDGGGGEVDLVIEGVDLRGAGGGVHLLAEARHLGAVCVGVELLTAAEFFFGGEVLADAGEGLLGGFESDFGGGDAAGSFGLLLAEALELEVLGLENDEMFEVSIHIGSLSRFPLLFFGGSQRRPGRLPQRLSVALSVYEALL